MEATLLIAVIICLVVYLWFNTKGSKLPPYPRRPLPIVGHLFYLERDSRTQFKKWRKQCGDIFSINICGSLVVVLNGYDVIREAFVKTADVFSDRKIPFFDMATGLPGKGVMFSSGINWKEQRSVALSILRKFGMGKNILAEKIQDEVSCFINYLASLNGEATNIGIMTNISTSNIICSIIIGHRFDYEDKDFRYLMNRLNSTATDHSTMSVINFLPWLKYLPGDTFKAKIIVQNVKLVFGMLNHCINLKKRDDIDINDADNLIDAYIAETNKKIKNGLSTYMDDDNLRKVIIDLFNAGSETTSSAIAWFLVYMLNYPDVQDKLYQEIKDVVGKNRIPNMQDRPKLPYLNAAISETLRLGSIVPLALMHSTSEDVSFRGYEIPKGKHIVPNLDSVLHDKAIWGEDVMTFRPERFLDGSGKLLDREEMVAFGIGRRVCLGEAMAVMELFLFLSNMIQRFQFLPGNKVPRSCNDYMFGFACPPQQYEVRCVERK
ncbi:hypothetical protein BsWGS_10166 [Bradybaena similaris]